MAKRKAVLIRIPEDLWEHVNRWARDELRSANAQVEYIIREAVRKRMGRTAIPPADASQWKDDVGAE
ncbi:MAG TPA: Arc family DNA binding domain-containing protein [Verrucomicrobiae bacterium]|nr:Arc family DNA binding domain-containing protein [Verrucomicrobiae bacterium]